MEADYKIENDFEEQNFIVPFGKFRGKDFLSTLKRMEGIEYFHWLMCQNWFEGRFPELYEMIDNLLPPLIYPKQGERLSPDSPEYKKNVEFNEDNKHSILKFYVPRILSPIRISTKSHHYRKLTQQLMERENCRCRFCSTRLSEGLIQDSLDGNYEDVSLKNMGINCPGCHLFRDISSHNSRKHLLIRHSQLLQSEIVQKSYAFYLKNKINPSPEDIDPNCQIVNKLKIWDKESVALCIIRRGSPSRHLADGFSGSTQFVQIKELEEINVGVFVQLLNESNYSQLSNDIITVKGFFGPNFDYSFLSKRLKEGSLSPFITKRNSPRNILPDPKFNFWDFDEIVEHLEPHQ